MSRCQNRDSEEQEENNGDLMTSRIIGRRLLLSSEKEDNGMICWRILSPTTHDKVRSLLM